MSVLGLSSPLALGCIARMLKFFGPLGVLLPTALAAVVMVLVRQLYVRKALGERQIGAPAVDP